MTLNWKKKNYQLKISMSSAWLFYEDVEEDKNKKTAVGNLFYVISHMQEIVIGHLN